MVRGEGVCRTLFIGSRHRVALVAGIPEFPEDHDVTDGHRNLVTTKKKRTSLPQDLFSAPMTH